MPARKIHSSELPERMIGFEIPTTLFTMGAAIDGSSYYAFRSGSPMFAIMGDSVQDVHAEAEATIERFLGKMQRYGFRT